MSTSKTEDPTPQRIRELRRKGNVAVSAELNKTAALVGAVLGLATVAPTMAGGLRALYEAACASTPPVEAMVHAGTLLCAGVMPIAGAAAMSAIAMGVVQTGMLFEPATVLPRSERFQLGQAWTSRFRVDALVNGALALGAALVCVLAAGVGVWRLAGESADLATTAGRDGVEGVASALADTMLVVGGVWLGVAATVALIDASWQRTSFLRRNRMSLKEIRDEYKQSEGDPQHKARRSRAHKELLAGDLRKSVAKADVVVVNPTHLAIGLRYRPDELDAPVVTVVGRGDQAKAIKREARRVGIPEYADRRCARAIIDVEVGEPVPDAMFEAIAVIFRWVASLEELSER